MKTTDNIWSNIFRKRPGRPETIRQLLARIPLFGQLRPLEIREIERIVHHRQFKPGEVVFWEGEPGVGMYIIERGEVAIFQDYGATGQKSLARLNEFDFFGEMALLNEEPRSATAVAMSETHLLGLFHPDLFELFERKPRLGVKILVHLADMLAARLRRTNSDLQELHRQACLGDGAGVWRNRGRSSSTSTAASWRCSARPC
jgi:CRP/FNR family cyclic AMP-dependent transcriptional regulator